LKVGLIALALALVFGVALIVLTVKKAYAEDHYVAYSSTRQSTYYKTITFGCGEPDCDFCRGANQSLQKYSKDQKGINTTIQYDTTYSRHKVTSEERRALLGFAYYRTLFTFWIACIVLTSLSGVTAAVAIPLYFKRRKIRRSDREDY